MCERSMAIYTKTGSKVVIRFSLIWDKTADSAGREQFQKMRPSRPIQSD
jgi:hypothetical protein